MSRKRKAEEVLESGYVWNVSLHDKEVEVDNHVLKLLEAGFVAKQKTKKTPIGIANYSTMTLGDYKLSRSLSPKNQNKDKRLCELATGLLEYLGDGFETVEGTDELRTALRRVVSYVRVPHLPTKAPLPQYKPADADDLHEITREVYNIPPYTWSAETLHRIIFRMRQVSTIFMRGSDEATQHLSTFLEQWGPFVMSRPDIITLLDPELIILDVPWLPPPGWGATQICANAHNTVANHVLPVGIPTNPPGVPAGAPAIPNVLDDSGHSDYFFTTGGSALHAGSFGTAMHFAHYAAVRGHWRVNTAIPPVYY